MLRDDADYLPHTYPGNELCLFYPGEWQHDRFLAVTIVPWTAEWLLHYEIWLATGEWTGGGRHLRDHAKHAGRGPGRDTAQPAF